MSFIKDAPEYESCKSWYPKDAWCNGEGDDLLHPGFPGAERLTSIKFFNVSNGICAADASFRASRKGPHIDTSDTITCQTGFSSGFEFVERPLQVECIVTKDEAANGLNSSSSIVRYVRFVVVLAFTAAIIQI